jgi:uncharacterized protein with von Willebrand factor type A (vWA) domain
MNEETGEVWLRRLVGTYPKAIWLNPLPQRNWSGTQSIAMIRRIMDDRMFPLTLEGLDHGIRRLAR